MPIPTPSKTSVYLRAYPEIALNYVYIPLFAGQLWLTLIQPVLGESGGWLSLPLAFVASVVAVHAAISQRARAFLAKSSSDPISAKAKFFPLVAVFRRSRTAGCFYWLACVGSIIFLWWVPQGLLGIWWKAVLTPGVWFLTTLLFQRVLLRILGHRAESLFQESLTISLKNLSSPQQSHQRSGSVAQRDIAERVGATTWSKLDDQGVDETKGSGRLTPLVPKSRHTVQELHAAAQSGDVKTLKACLDAGINPDELDIASVLAWTPLHIAVTHGQEGSVEALLSAGADVNARSALNSSALHMAAKKGYSKIARLLITKGANIDALDGEGSTPLMSAAIAPQPAVVEVLLSAGANTEIGDSVKRMTALDWATRFREKGHSGNYDGVVKAFEAHRQRKSCDNP